MISSADRDAALRLDQHFPRHCWWVIATTAEVTSTPISRQVLQRRVVLVRTQNGVIIALDDRCPHRRAPLSLGRLVNEEIECLYHGLRFNREGQCTRVPGQPNIPSALKASSYPVYEHGPFVWIWVGETERADPDLLPNIQWLSDTKYLRTGNYMQINCDYVILWENIMDAAHFPFLHGNRSGSVQVNFSDYLQTTTEANGNIIKMDFRVSARPPTNLELRSMDVKPEDKIETAAKSTLVLPSYWIQETEIIHLSTSTETINSYFYKALQGVTPISPGRCHWWWVTIQNYGYPLPNKWQEAYDNLLEEDRNMLERVQVSINEDTRGTHARDALIRSDRTVIDIRIALQRILETELR